jgi:hypothetical protein
MQKACETQAFWLLQKGRISGLINKKYKTWQQK